ncbi:MAG: cytochrome c [Acidobacteriia bacterium]|nr:cytochrome c [Terriglobia bacterium]
MRYFLSKVMVAALAFVTGIACVSAQTQPQPQKQPPSKKAAQTKQKPQASAPSPVPLYSGVGTSPTPEDLGNLALAAGFMGKDLPPGSGTAQQGAPLYLGRCSMCHGQDSEGVHWDPMAFSPLHGPRLEGGTGVQLYKPSPGQITTIAFTAPSPMVIFDTIAVEMPMFRAGTLNANQVYALTAFILFKNGLIKEDEVMNSETLAKVKMPNRNSFPASDDVYMDMKKRGCYKTYGVCLNE